METIEALFEMFDRAIELGARIMSVLPPEVVPIITPVILTGYVLAAYWLARLLARVLPFWINIPVLTLLGASTGLTASALFVVAPATRTFGEHLQHPLAVGSIILGVGIGALVSIRGRKERLELSKKFPSGRGPFELFGMSWSQALAFWTVVAVGGFMTLAFLVGGEVLPALVAILATFVLAVAIQMVPYVRSIEH